MTIPIIVAYVDFLTDTYQSICKTFEDYKVLHKDTGRVKHSVLPFVGQLMSTLFGSISENDFENINRNIDVLAENQEQIVHDLDMSLSVLNMTRVQVNENRRSIIDLIKIFKLQGQLESKLTRLGQFIHTYLQFPIIFDENQVSNTKGNILHWKLTKGNIIHWKLEVRT